MNNGYLFSDINILFNLYLFEDFYYTIQDITSLVDSIICTNPSKDVMKYFNIYKDHIDSYITGLNNSPFIKMLQESQIIQLM